LKKSNLEGLSIDITRGKPDAFQLDLANDLLKMDVEPFDGDVDLRNYGEPFGISDARKLGSQKSLMLLKKIL